MLTRMELEVLTTKGIFIDSFTHIRLGVEMTISTGEQAGMKVTLKDSEDFSSVDMFYTLPKGSTIAYEEVLDEIKELFRQHPQYRLKLVTTDDSFFFFECQQYHF